MTLGVKTTGDWEKAVAKLQFLEKNAETALKRAVLQEAHELRNEMVTGIDGGAPGGKAFQPHATPTLYLRRVLGKGKGTKIMIASSGLRNAIRVVPLPGGGAFVGVSRSASKGRFRIAQIQEQGRTITITPRMRRFLHAMLRKAGAPPPPPGAAKISIRIPPRPFISPIVAKYSGNDELQKRIVANVAAQLGL